MTALTPEADWRRLDRRMLLVHPVTELIRFLPVIIGILVLGSGGGDGRAWHLIGVAVPIAIGIFRYVATRFRITAGQIELHRGVLGRNVLTAPLDRVRTVELTASPIHRILGLEKVEIGTGSAAKDGDGGLVLDSLGRAEAERLRAALLHRNPEDEAVAETASSARTVLVFDPGWVRYAPLTSSGIVIALAALGALAGPLANTDIVADVANSEAVEGLAALAIPVLVIGGILGLAVSSAVAASVGYLIGNWDFTLTRDQGAGTFGVRRGALTTRETSIDIDRVRGVEVHEPIGLRLARAGRLDAVVTGLGRRTEASSPLVPVAPREVVHGVAGEVLAESAPLAIPLRRHGPAARRRRYVRAIVPGLLLLGALGLAVPSGALPWWVLVLAGLVPLAGWPLAHDRYARLGHALTRSYLVVRSGSLRGRRTALQRSGIIGWNIDQTFFQRRAGLVTLTATTAAGSQSYEVLDVPEAWAVALADESVPGLVGQFLATAGDGATGTPPPGQ